MKGLINPCPVLFLLLFFIKCSTSQDYLHLHPHRPTDFYDDFDEPARPAGPQPLHYDYGYPQPVQSPRYSRPPNCRALQWNEELLEDIQKLKELIEKPCGMYESAPCPANARDTICKHRETNIQNILGNCLGDVSDLPMHDLDPLFMKMVTRMHTALSKTKTRSEFIKMARLLKENPKMNNRLWYRGVGAALSQRQDFDGFQFPETIYALPDYFTGGENGPPGCNPNPQCHKFYSTCNADPINGDENFLFYFREDLGVNSHHAQWHTVHGYKQAVHQDRRGELFYYMHRFMLARYDTERLSLCLPKLTPYEFIEGGTIDTGYTPFIQPYNMSIFWLSRPPYLPLPYSIDNDDDEEDTGDDSRPCKPKSQTHLRDLLKSIKEVEKTIKTHNHNRLVVDDIDIRHTSPVDGVTMDILGDILEASTKSVHSNNYSSIHNLGHDFIAKSTKMHHGNTAEGKIGVGLMGDTASAMRDPIFYRWHLFVDNLFGLYKSILPSYTADHGQYPLRWRDVRLSYVDVSEVSDLRRPPQTNVLHTFWTQQIFKMTAPQNPYQPITCPPQKNNICFKTLEHLNFKYHIHIDNYLPKNVTSTVRIFLAPRKGQDGRRLTLVEQRDYIFLLDIFNIELTPGPNGLDHSSTVSSVTTARPAGGSIHDDKFIVQGVQGTPPLQGECRKKKSGCGWPHHLLIPRGQEGPGMEFDLIVMVTNEKKYPFDFDIGKDDGLAPVICGISGKFYPDKKLPMGYPFDRLPYSPRGPFLEDYIRGIDNMRVEKIRIIHYDVFVPDQTATLSAAILENMDKMPRPRVPTSRCGGSPWPTRPTTTSPWTPWPWPTTVSTTPPPYTWPTPPYSTWPPWRPTRPNFPHKVACLNNFCTAICNGRQVWCLAEKQRYVRCNHNADCGHGCSNICHT